MTIGSHQCILVWAFFSFRKSSIVKIVNAVTRRVGDFFYSEFGTLKKVEVEGKYLVITNEKGEQRRKSMVYASWTTSKTKLEGMIDESIITRSPATSNFSSREWFSDMIRNELYTAVVPAKDGEGSTVEVSHRLLQAPEGSDLIREMLFDARIRKQYAVESQQRLASYREFALEQQIEDFQEESIQRTEAEKELDKKQKSEVKEAVEKWLENDEFRPFRIVKTRDTASNSLTHVDKHFAMRYRIDTTGMSKIRVAVKGHISDNFILVDIMDGLGEGIMSLPRPCILGVIYLHKENVWQIKTVRPIHKLKTWYKLERHYIDDKKDTNKPLDYWFGVYDKILKEVAT